MSDAVVAVRTNRAELRGEPSVVVAAGSEGLPPKHVGGQCGINISLNPQIQRYPVQGRENGEKNGFVIIHFVVMSIRSAICSVQFDSFVQFGHLFSCSFFNCLFIQSVLCDEFLLGFHSIIRSVIHSFIRSFVHSCIHSLGWDDSSVVHNIVLLPPLSIQRMTKRTRNPNRLN